MINQISNGVNLLPPQQIKELIKEQRDRLFLIFGFLTIIFLIALSLALFAVKVYISGKIQNESVVAPLQVQDQEKEIMAINKELQNLEDFYDGSRNFTELFEKISKIIPEDIRLSSFSLNPTKEKGSFSASLQGLSPSREILFQLKKRLESEADLKDINFPPSNWVKPENIEFNTNFTIGL